MTHFMFGKRIIKTGLAVFFTAQVCQWFGWPSLFAVIAAIVTIEPSIAMSIKKSMFRFPSAVIGAAFAMLFDALLGQQPVTYMLSAVATIYVIQLLKWNDSLIIATLTSVNMITLTDAHFGETFLVRLGTTTIGLLVSALVNYLIFPPRYAKSISKSVPQAIDHTLDAANRIVAFRLRIPDVPKSSAPELEERLHALKTELSDMLKLVSWQLADHKYKPLAKQELKQITNAKRTIAKLQAVCSYLDVIIHTPSVSVALDESTRIDLWRQWLRFEDTDSASRFPGFLDAIEQDDERLLAESLFCHIEYIHILLRQLPMDSYRKMGGISAAVEGRNDSNVHTLG